MTTETTPYDVHTAAADAINLDAELFGRGVTMNWRSLANLRTFITTFGVPDGRVVSYDLKKDLFSIVRPPISLTLLPLARNAYGVK